MEQTKTPLQSLTVISAAGSVVVSLAGALGLAVEPALAAQAVNCLCQLVSAAMAAVAIYGRMRATARIVRAP